MNIKQQVEGLLQQNKAYTEITSDIRLNHMWDMKRDMVILTMSKFVNDAVVSIDMNVSLFALRNARNVDEYVSSFLDMMTTELDESIQRYRRRQGDFDTDIAGSDTTVVPNRSDAFLVTKAFQMISKQSSPKWAIIQRGKINP